MSALEAMPQIEKTSLFGTAVHAVLRRHRRGSRRLTMALTAARP